MEVASSPLDNLSITYSENGDILSITRRCPLFGGNKSRCRVQKTMYVHSNAAKTLAKGPKAPMRIVYSILYTVYG